MIGVILMVAVTVILAAVIAAFVFGMGSNISKTKVVAATAQVSNGEVYVTYQGGQDASQVISLTVGGDLTFDPASVTVTAPASVQVGWNTTAAHSTNPKDHVTVTGGFADGTSQVILDTFV